MVLVVGLGSGRCGTMSLAALLGTQDRADVAHERAPALRWAHEDFPQRHFRRVKAGLQLYGDVGFYYLPHVKDLVGLLPGVRFVCLKRDRQEVIDSFCRYLPDDLNHWQTHVDDTYRRSNWDLSYPKYDASLSREEAIGAYWDDYYAEAQRLEASMPECFRIFPVDALNTLHGVLAILGFVGVQDPKPVYGLHLHRTQPIEQGAMAWPPMLT